MPVTKTKMIERKGPGDLPEGEPGNYLDYLSINLLEDGEGLIPHSLNPTGAALVVEGGPGASVTFQPDGSIRTYGRIGPRSKIVRAISIAGTSWELWQLRQR